ncbi:MAG: M1 family metallopeptidase [Actinobacteria bacterium]|nr:MAG: M1 family metallopeptidase [Actinomycetota bacterium]
MPRRVAGVLAALVALGFVSAANAEAARGPGHARYDLALRWHSSHDVLDGVEHVGFENTHPGKLRSVWLRLWANGVASCAHPRITLKVLSGGRAAGWAADCTALKLRLGHDLATGRRAAIRLRFSVRVPGGNGSFGHLSGGPALLGNAIPILAVTDAAGTHLEPYSTLGEAAYSLTSSWHVRLDVRRGLSAATTGVQTGSSALSSTTRRLKFQAPRARDFELAIGHFHKQATTVHGVRIRFSDMLPGGAASTRLRGDVLAAARSDVLGYEQRFGTYGAPDLDIVQTPSLDGEGMEYPELVFVEMTPSSADSGSWLHTRALLAHEIAHQWFYGIVGNNQWREPWLDESFATLASGFPAHHCTSGDPLAGYPSSVRLTSNMGFFDAHPSGWYYSGLYGGGACALRDLRAGFGTQPFNDFLRAWVAAHRYGVATTAALVAAIRAAAPSGFDVDGWLRDSRIDVR